MENAQRYKMTALGPLGFLRGVMMEMGPLMAPWLVAGLVGLLAAGASPWTPARLDDTPVARGVHVQPSKPHCAVASFPPVIAGLAVLIESATEHRARWLRAPPGGVLVADLALVAPFAVPMLSVDSFIAYQRLSACVRRRARSATQGVAAVLRRSIRLEGAGGAGGGSRAIASDRGPSALPHRGRQLRRSRSDQLLRSALRHPRGEPAQQPLPLGIRPKSPAVFVIVGKAGRVSSGDSAK